MFVLCSVLGPLATYKLALMIYQDPRRFYELFSLVFSGVVITVVLIAILAWVEEGEKND